MFKYIGIFYSFGNQRDRNRKQGCSRLAFDIQKQAASFAYHFLQGLHVFRDCSLVPWILLGPGSQFAMLVILALWYANSLRLPDFGLLSVNYSGPVPYLPNFPQLLASEALPRAKCYLAWTPRWSPSRYSLLSKPRLPREEHCHSKFWKLNATSGFKQCFLWPRRLPPDPAESGIRPKLQITTKHSFATPGSLSSAFCKATSRPCPGRDTYKTANYSQ